MNYLHSPAAEFKFVGDSGLVEGYASIFGNVDLGGDRILPGAFKEFNRTRDGKVRVLFQHKADSPIGKADVSEDARGLHFKAQLVLEDPLAKRVYTYMKEGIVDGMSIGYDILPGGSEVTGEGVRNLSALKLWEISGTAFPMNQLARVEAVKSVTDCGDVRELEDLLRARLGLSARKAKAVATRCWPVLNDRDGRDDDREDREAEEAKTILQLVSAHLESLNGIILSKGR
jgi:HK97 family phage prohead protease